MSKFAILLSLVTISFAARGATPLPPVEATVSGEILRGLIDGLQVDVNNPTGCIAQGPILDNIYVNITSFWNENKYWDLFFESVDYTNEIVLIIDKCQLPELNNKFVDTFSEDGLAAALLKVGTNYNFFTTKFSDLSTAWGFAQYYQVGLHLGEIIRKLYDFNL